MKIQTNQVSNWANIQWLSKGKWEERNVEQKNYKTFFLYIHLSFVPWATDNEQRLKE